MSTSAFDDVRVIINYLAGLSVKEMNDFTRTPHEGLGGRTPHKALEVGDTTAVARIIRNLQATEGPDGA